MPRFLINLSLTVKIICLVGLLGALAIAITLYSLLNLYEVDRDYRALIDKEAQASMLINNAALELSDASRLVFAVLTEQEADKMRAVQEVLDEHQARFLGIVSEARPLLSAQDQAFVRIMEQQTQVFALAAEIVEWAARWRGDRALNVIHQRFDPALNALKGDIATIHDRTVAHYQATSAHLSSTTRATLLNTSLAFGLALIGVIGLAAYLSVTHISRPIVQLTRGMGRLTHRQYQQRIDYTDRNDEVGQMAQAMEVFRDTLERAEHLELAAEAAKAKAAFLATMSHEVRTPMNAILGLARQALKHPLEPRQRERMERIVHAGEHLLGIINDILDFTRLDSGHLRIERIPFAPGLLLKEMRGMLEEKAQEKNLELTCEFDAEMPRLLGDPLRINQILLNYTHNAIKFSNSGEIKVRLVVEQSATGLPWLYGEVIDQGIGIRAEDQERLFTPFEQADASTTRKFGGTGLGLAISRSLAELMEGSVGVRSVPGEGSVFWFRVRVDIESASERPAHSKMPVNPRQLVGMRLLLVDDTEVNRLLAAELLQEAGLEVETAVDGFDALNRLAEKEDGYFDAVLLDLMMPELDGMETCRRIRQQARFKQLPVIAVSANSSARDIQQCQAVGMNGHVAKPIDERQLWQVLVNCLIGKDITVTDDKPLSRDAMTAAVFDPQPLSKLQQRIPEARFARVLSMLVKDCRQRAEEIYRLAQEARTEPLRQLSHDMIGTAGHAGMKRLAEQAAQLNQALHDGDQAETICLALQLPDLVTEALDVLEQTFRACLEPNSEEPT
ncbi:response regulator [Billgrantia tianxiuensis]|uniref:histidine kinase n=2 Tax=Oceanospirillales TaxID=135619 RepID=A0A6I6SM31_9GAMM|nr:response regulator [Halomonas tianxiuensis]